MATMNPPVSQTRSFSTVFLIELWERFGYYGMQALMIYFMVERLGFDDDKANLTWGAFTALVYAAPAIGGWVGDQLLGTRRTMMIGACILALGYGLLSVPTDSQYFLYCALGVVVVGNGLFKPNAGNLVRKIYEGDDSKIDSAFTLYYMAVNIGSTVSILLTPWIKDHWGWNVAFAVCMGGLITGLINYAFMFRTLSHIGSPPDKHPVHKGKLAAVLGTGVVTLFVVAFILQHDAVAKGCVYFAGVVILAIFAYLIAKSTRSERSGLIAALVLTVQTLLFFIFYQQMSTSLALFALRNVSAEFSIFGIHLFDWLPAQYQALNPLWIMVLSPILAWSYTYFGKRGKDLPIAGKFALGFAVVAIGFFIYGVGGRFAVEGRVSSWIMIWGYGSYSLGELLVSGLGLAMIARYVPERMGGFMMGAYYVATGISQYLGSVIANLASIPKDMTNPMESLALYTDLFNKLGFVAVGGTVLAIILLPMMKRLSATHSEHSQAKTATAPASAEAAAE
ncbi:peptide MFS transporter [Pendulispora albinea]|uniref:Oligopeptide:H+ symporter n=1 Tax=Pendulispora albinea TaxID=2741071 RepID=A0ABZ2M590_9BACT